MAVVAGLDVAFNVVVSFDGVGPLYVTDVVAFDVVNVVVALGCNGLCVFIVIGVFDADVVPF